MREEHYFGEPSRAEKVIAGISRHPIISLMSAAAILTVGGGYVKSTLDENARATYPASFTQAERVEDFASQARKVMESNGVDSHLGCFVKWGEGEEVSPSDLNNERVYDQWEDLARRGQGRCYSIPENGLSGGPG